MTKTDLIDTMANTLNMPKAQVKKVVDALVEGITKSLVRGEKVQVSGLGTFEIRRKKEREGRNPQTNAKIMIAARNAVGYKPAKPLKEAVK